MECTSFSPAPAHPESWILQIFREGKSWFVGCLALPSARWAYINHILAASKLYDCDSNSRSFFRSCDFKMFTMKLAFSLLRIAERKVITIAIKHFGSCSSNNIFRNFYFIAFAHLFTGFLKPYTFYNIEWNKKVEGTENPNKSGSTQSKNWASIFAAFLRLLDIHVFIQIKWIIDDYGGLVMLCHWHFIVYLDIYREAFNRQHSSSIKFPGSFKIFSERQLSPGEKSYMQIMCLTQILAGKKT